MCILINLNNLQFQTSFLQATFNEPTWFYLGLHEAIQIN